jgi:hypothetical protein
MRKLILIFIFFFLVHSAVHAEQYDRGYESVPTTQFVKKGSWLAGGTVRYSQHINDDYNLLVISNINSEGYNLSANAKGLYVFKDNLAAGLRISYDRGMLDLSSADLAVATIQMSAKDCYQINHKYSAYGVFRAYIPFNGVKRIALFADLMLGGSYKQGKSYNGSGAYFKGTYTQAYSLDLAVDPGIVAFLTDRVALEMNVGIFGVSYRWNNQLHNQISNGHMGSTSAGFMINLLSIGVGVSYYFLR